MRASRQCINYSYGHSNWHQDEWRSHFHSKASSQMQHPNTSIKNVLHSFSLAIHMPMRVHYPSHFISPKHLLYSKQHEIERFKLPRLQVYESLWIFAIVMSWKERLQASLLSWYNGMLLMLLTVLHRNRGMMTPRKALVVVLYSLTQPPSEGFWDQVTPSARDKTSREPLQHGSKEQQPAMSAHN